MNNNIKDKNYKILVDHFCDILEGNALSQNLSRADVSAAFMEAAYHVARQDEEDAQEQRTATGRPKIAARTKRTKKAA